MDRQFAFVIGVGLALSCSDGEKEVLQDADGGSVSVAGGPADSSSGGAASSSGGEASGGSRPGEGGTGGAFSSEPGDSWSPVGDAVTASSEAIDGERPDLAIDTQDRPVVAWTQTVSGQTHGYAARWDGASWQNLGGPVEANSQVGTAVQAPALALDRDTPLLAWLETYPGAAGARPAVYAAKWSGSEWTLLAGEVPESRESNGVSVLAVAGTPTVAWTDNTGNTKAHVAAFASGSWSEQTLDAAGATAMAQNGSQQFLATGKNGQILVLVNKGSGWQVLGQVPKHNQASGFSTAPSLAVDAAGHPIVAWQESAGPGNPSRAVASRWTGSEWVALAELSSGVSGELLGQFDPDVAARGGRIVVTWAEKRRSDGDITTAAHVRQWRDDQWVRVAVELDAELPPSQTGGPAIALDSKGRSMVAYEALDGVNSVIRVAREQ